MSAGKELALTPCPTGEGESPLHNMVRAVEALRRGGRVAARESADDIHADYVGMS
jgi:hypothetical protein